MILNREMDSDHGIKDSLEMLVIDLFSSTKDPITPRTIKPFLMNLKKHKPINILGAITHVQHIPRDQ